MIFANKSAGLWSVPISGGKAALKTFIYKSVLNRSKCESMNCMGTLFKGAFWPFPDILNINVKIDES